MILSLKNCCVQDIEKSLKSTKPYHTMGPDKMLLLVHDCGTVLAYISSLSHCLELNFTRHSEELLHSYYPQQR